MKMSASDITHRFEFHPATSAEKKLDHSSIRYACKSLAVNIDNNVPDGREKALAITKIEEAMFWANAAIARSAE